MSDLVDELVLGQIELQHRADSLKIEGVWRDQSIEVTQGLPGCHVGQHQAAELLPGGGHAHDARIARLPGGRILGRDVTIEDHRVDHAIRLNGEDLPQRPQRDLADDRLIQLGDLLGSPRLGLDQVQGLVVVTSP
jgi:hypothetical protein